MKIFYDLKNENEKKREYFENSKQKIVAIFKSAQKQLGWCGFGVWLAFRVGF